MKFIDRYIELIKGYEARLEGRFLNSTPLESLPGLGNFLGNIPKGVSIGITADSNVGKTPLSKNFAYGLHLAKQKNPKIEYKIVYFALEEREDKFLDRVILHFHKMKYGKKLEYSKLQSNSKFTLTSSEWEDIKNLEKSVDDFMANIQLYDYLYDPKEIYAACIETLIKHGTLKTKMTEFGREIVSYIPHNPYLHILVIMDHANDLTNSRASKSDTQDAMNLWCKIFGARNLAKTANCTVINVLQQVMDKTQYTTRGNKIVAKLEPSKEGLGNSKEVYRSLDILLGLFAPSFFELETYNNYDIRQLKHNYRALLLLKNRDGKPRGTLDLIIDDNSFNFIEIPKVILTPHGDIQNKAEIDNIYKKYHYI